MDWEKFRGLADKIALELEMEVVEFQFHPARQKNRRSRIVLTIDHLYQEGVKIPKGASHRKLSPEEMQADSFITVSECQSFSRQLETELEILEKREGREFEPFTLEVSSPGLNRPLTREGHFQRFQGRRIELMLLEPIAVGERLQKRVRGLLHNRTADYINLKLEKGDFVDSEGDGTPKEGVAKKRRPPNGEPVQRDLLVPLAVVKKAILLPRLPW